MRRAVLCLAVAVLSLSPRFCTTRRTRRGGPPQNLSFRFMGPAVGNRIAAAAGVPGDPSTYYAGAASGGVWKSTDNGATWSPIFDSMPVQAIGALAVSASDPKQVWAGTGEAWAIRDSDMMGNGIYKSTDAGRTWQHMGLDETGPHRAHHRASHQSQYRLCLRAGPRRPGRSRSAASTRPPMAAELAARAVRRSEHRLLRPVHGCQRSEHAVRRHVAGGDAHLGDVQRRAGQRRVRHARWRRARGSRIEGHGMPKSPVGKIDVAIAPTNSKRIYALIQTADQGSVWRSNDGGENWANGSWQRALIGRAGYYIRMAVNPMNPDEVLVANSSFWLSTDGGKIFRSCHWGGDTHDIWIDPTTPTASS